MQYLPCQLKNFQQLLRPLHFYFIFLGPVVLSKKIEETFVGYDHLKMLKIKLTVTEAKKIHADINGDLAKIGHFEQKLHYLARNSRDRSAVRKNFAYMHG